MTIRRIALEFNSDLGTARAIARASLALLEATAALDGSVTVDGFQMNPTDTWRGNYTISIEEV